MGNAQIHDRVKVMTAVGSKVQLTYENHTLKDYGDQRADAGQILRHNKAGRMLRLQMEDTTFMEELLAVEGGMMNFMKEVLQVSNLLPLLRVKKLYIY